MDKQRILEFVKGVSLFDSLNEHEIEQLVAHQESKNYKKASTLKRPNMKKSEKGNLFNALVTGSVFSHFQDCNSF